MNGMNAWINERMLEAGFSVDLQPPEIWMNEWMAGAGDNTAPFGT